VDAGADRPPARARPGLCGARCGHQDPPDVVWPPPCAAEIPELPENPEPPVTAEPELLAEPDEPVEVPAEEPVCCDAALPLEPPEPVVLAWDEPGRAYATTPVTATPAAPTATVAARSRDRPCRRATAAVTVGRAAPCGACLPRPGPG
jgi:hypothetical protein